MDIKKKIKNIFNSRPSVVLFAILFLFISAACIFQYNRATEYKNKINNQYNRSFAELVQYVNNIETSLAKGAAVTNPKTLAKIANQISSKSEFAMADLGQLPINQAELQNTSKFLSQVGDFTQAVSLKYMSGGEITENEHKTLADLSKYASKLNDSLLKIQDKVIDKAVNFNDVEENFSVFDNEKTVMADEIKNIEQDFKDYPSLIYDGPFSEHVEKAKPKLLEGKSTVSKQEAQKRCIEIVGKERMGKIKLVSETEGKIPSYTFEVVPDEHNNERVITVEITKNGGMLSWMLDNRAVNSSNINISKAVKNAKNCLKSLGIDDMEENYYEIKNNTATVNFAYKFQNVTVYPDLVKVKVALDSGEIVGIECKGYIANHKSRLLPSDIISENEAKKSLSKALTVTEKPKLAIIPTEYLSEILCYEFKAKLGKNDFLIYINAETGKEEDILMLLISKEGTLTI